MEELKKILDTIILSEISEQLPYSILPMMYGRISSKELLHSQIIASLLNPDEKHNLGDRPLSLFLKKIGCDERLFAEDLSKTNVEIEAGVENMRRIDILLTNGDSAIIIENKLNNAVDQPDQLKDYLKSIKKREYKQIIMVYLPLYAYKSAKEKVDTRIVNLYPQDLIEWLSECNSPACDNYIDLLKYMNQSNRNFMEAKKIMAELSPEQIEKLVHAADVVNSTDWSTARFEPITIGVKKMIPNVISKINNQILSLWLPDDNYDFWIDVYARNLSYDMYVVDYKVGHKESQPDKLINTGCVYDSVEGEKRYFRKSKQYSFPSPDNQELINDIVNLLELSQNRECKLNCVR